MSPEYFKKRFPFLSDRCLFSHPFSFSEFHRRFGDEWCMYLESLKNIRAIKYTYSGPYRIFYEKNVSTLDEEVVRNLCQIPFRDLPKITLGNLGDISRGFILWRLSNPPTSNT
jgi:hypothetical protein